MSRVHRFSHAVCVRVNELPAESFSLYLSPSHFSSEGERNRSDLFSIRQSALNTINRYSHFILSYSNAELRREAYLVIIECFAINTEGYFNLPFIFLRELVSIALGLEADSLPLSPATPLSRSVKYLTPTYTVFEEEPGPSGPVGALDPDLTANTVTVDLKSIPVLSAPDIYAPAPSLQPQPPATPTQTAVFEKAPSSGTHDGIQDPFGPSHPPHTPVSGEEVDVFMGTDASGQGDSPLTASPATGRMESPPAFPLLALLSPPTPPAVSSPGLGGDGRSGSRGAYSALLEEARALARELSGARDALVDLDDARALALRQVRDASVCDSTSVPVTLSVHVMSKSLGGERTRVHHGRDHDQEKIFVHDRTPQP